MRAVVIVLLVVGLYLLLDHVPPLPLNHEDIGLGKVHLAHAVGGLVALGGGIFLLRRARRSRPASEAR